MAAVNDMRRRMATNDLAPPSRPRTDLVSSTRIDSDQRTAPEGAEDASHAITGDQPMTGMGGTARLRPLRMTQRRKAMPAEPYDIARSAAMIIHVVLGSGVPVEDAIKALETAERMLREAYDAERGLAEEHALEYPALH